MTQHNRPRVVVHLRLCSVQFKTWYGLEVVVFFLFLNLFMYGCINTYNWKRLYFLSHIIVAFLPPAEVSSASDKVTIWLFNYLPAELKNKVSICRAAFLSSSLVSIVLQACIKCYRPHTHLVLFYFFCKKNTSVTSCTRSAGFSVSIKHNLF